MILNEDFYFTQISTIYRKFQIFVNEELNQYGVHSSELPYLIALLFHEDGILQDNLSKATKIDKAATSRALKSLEDKKFIYRKESQHSNRHKQVFLMDRALQAKPHIEAAIKKWSDILFSKLSEGEKQVMIKCLYKMASATTGEPEQAPVKASGGRSVYGFY